MLNVNSGEQASFGSLFAALEALGRVERLPLIDAAVLETAATTTCACAPCSTRSSFPGRCGCSRSGGAIGRSRASGIDGRCEANKNAQFVTLLAVLGMLLWLVALLSFTRVTENTDDFAQRQYWILLINSVGITACARADREQPVAAGARLPAPRAGVAAACAHGHPCWCMVAITPLVGVYIFSVEFINRGIDNWFNVDVEKGLGDALELGQTVLGIQTSSRLDEVNDFALQLADRSERRCRRDAEQAPSKKRRARAHRLRPNNQVLGITSVDPEPRCNALSDGRSAAAAAPAAGSTSASSRRRTASIKSSPPPRFTLPRTNDELEFVQAKFPMEQRLSTLANAVQGSYNQVNELTYLRTAPEVQLHVDLEPRAADLAARVRLRRVLLLAAARDADPIVDAGHAGGGARRLRHARADAGARRDRLPRALVQRHDAAARARQRGRAPEPAASRARAPQARGHPRAACRRASCRSSPICGYAPRITPRARFSASTWRRTSANRSSSSRQSEPLLGQFVGVAQGHLQRGDREWREQIMLRAEGGRRV